MVGGRVQSQGEFFSFLLYTYLHAIYATSFPLQTYETDMQTSKQQTSSSKKAIRQPSRGCAWASSQTSGQPNLKPEKHLTSNLQLFQGRHVPKYVRWLTRPPCATRVSWYGIRWCREGRLPCGVEWKACMYVLGRYPNRDAAIGCSLARSSVQRLYLVKVVPIFEFAFEFEFECCF
ncbi:hypothetical protein IWX50DRAFT_639233 [Phyllosticta citricarpa]